MSEHLVCAIDPGCDISAFVTYATSTRRIVAHGTESNEALLSRLRVSYGRPIPAAFGPLVVEQIESFGMAVGKETFETVWWAGRFHEAWRGEAHRMTRKAVKLHLCESTRATDSNIRQAILDRFGGTAAIGTKKNQGPLYGVKGHEFAALAVALTYADTRLGKETHVQQLVG